MWVLLAKVLGGSELEKAGLCPPPSFMWALYLKRARPFAETLNHNVSS